MLTSHDITSFTTELAVDEEEGEPLFSRLKVKVEKLIVNLGILLSD